MNDTVLSEGDEASALSQVKHQHINLKLAALGQPTCRIDSDHSYLAIADSLLKHYSRQRRLLAAYRCPADQRIQDFLNNYLAENGVEQRVELPGTTFILDEPGMARELSLPLKGTHFHSELVDSYRLLQGILHNPRSDRRTTKGVFHIAAGGLPVPADKLEVPVTVFGALLNKALDPPPDLLRLPATSQEPEAAELWVSLLVRPTVRPAVAGVLPSKSLEVRLFAPGSLVSNLDFVETIFGNAGDPFLPENDAALDIEHWTGQSGCIILAPHLVGLSKKKLGLPHYDDASEQQRRDGMCWQNEDERYNDGNAFKLVCRDRRGVIVTIIADNYFGYSKKEIKSQISYSANIFGGCEEEHAGGALAFPRFNLGETYIPRPSDMIDNSTFSDLCHRLAEKIDVQSEGYAVDTHHADIIYLPEDAQIYLNHLSVSWRGKTDRQQIKLLAKHAYVYPNGFTVHMERHPHAPSWRLIGTLGEGTFCHKPSTVSGGGKSEISKSIAGALISGPVYVGDFEEDLEQVREIFERDYSDRFRYPGLQEPDARSLLGEDRSLGSVIRLLTPSISEYSDAYNQWLKSVPHHVLALVFMIKRFYRTEWGSDWQKHFSVDTVNGSSGHELKYNGRKLMASYLRVGYGDDGGWRLFKLRQDYVAANKVQMEDDITASTVLPVSHISGLNPAFDNPCIKLVENCEQRLFQRPDEAINRGADIQTEADLSSGNNFISNFEPMSSKDAREIIEDVAHFEEFSEPMRRVIRDAASMDEKLYFVSSSHPRLVNGKPSPNVRYLQPRPDLASPRMSYLAEIGTRLARGLEPDQPVYFPVNAVLAGRRNNPPEPGARSLAVYNPIHYQELPELFMELICSLTGKSPSTTGAGSEGALTKGPFNSLCGTADLNTALVSFILCNYDGFTTAAGHIGPQRRIDHDISMLIPEIWCRLPVEHRDPEYMIEHGYLEKMEDLEYEGRTVYASRLGYRMTERFVHDHFGKLFDTPTAVFDEAMLCPEIQDLDAFIDGIDNICEAQQRVAHGYFTDGSIDDACPPLQALLHIMANGNYNGKTVDDPAIREMFTRDYLLQSDWYSERLAIKQARDVKLWRQHRAYLDIQMRNLDDDEIDKRLEMAERIREADRMIGVVSSQSYLDRLQGTLGADWIHREQ
ncbi:hypothetical protein ACFL3A_12375 [Pseudomonadota bacterium]